MTFKDLKKRLTSSSNQRDPFALTAKDDKGAASNNPSVVTITVKHINHAPTANAGQDQTPNASYVISLDGSKSKDPDSGDTLTYSWIQTSGPNVTLNGANSPIATFTAPEVITSDTILKFSLTVKDDKGAASNNPAVVSVTVKAAAPVPSLPSITTAPSNN
jgi:large repetitive protein